MNVDPYRTLCWQNFFKSTVQNRTAGAGDLLRDADDEQGVQRHCHQARGKRYLVGGLSNNIYC